jgi:hypothetical protein
MVLPLPRGAGGGGTRKSPPSIKFTASEQGTLEVTDSESMEIAKEEGMETDPPHSVTEKHTD